MEGNENRKIVEFGRKRIGFFQFFGIFFLEIADQIFEKIFQLNTVSRNVIVIFNRNLYIDFSSKIRDINTLYNSIKIMELFQFLESDIYIKYFEIAIAIIILM